MSAPTFASLGAPDGMAARLAARGIVEPFAIQAATLPDALLGLDVCGRAPTGSGKTIAFGIPLIARSTRGKPNRPSALVLVPTRELAAQVARELRMLAGPKGARVTTIYGGVGFVPQIRELSRGTDIVVACPGRLSDLIRQQHVSLDRVGFVVVDEADRMADMGFLPEVRRLLDSVKHDRQTLLFSATLDGEVDTLIRHYQRDPVRHELAADDSAHNHRHVFWHSERAGRAELLADVLATASPAIVFCRTKHGTDRLAKQLTRAGVAAEAIHGDRSQAQRTRALAAFADGKVDALVATDVAARGIHVDDVAIVVHFDPPATDKDYIHRSGRTGRAGRTGVVLSLVDSGQRKAALKLQRQLGLAASVDRADIADLHSVEGAGRPPRTAKRMPATSPVQQARRRRRRPSSPRRRVSRT